MRYKKEYLSHIDIIYDLVDALCYDSGWEEIDTLLELNMDEDNMTRRIAWLTTSRWCPVPLKNRQRYYDVTHRILSEANKDADWILQGLENRKIYKPA